MQQPQGTPAIPAAFGQGGGAAAADPSSAAKGTEVGSDTNDVKVAFKNGTGLNFSTPSGDFTMHAGFWVQWDNVWWRQNSTLNGPTSATIEPHWPSGGWRLLAANSALRGRHIYETCEYRFNIALENDQFASVRARQILDRHQQDSRDRHGACRSREELLGPGRRHGQLEPLHDVHGAVPLFPIDRARPELRQWRLVREYMVRRSSLWVVCCISAGRRQQRRLLRHRAIWLANPLDQFADLRRRRPPSAAPRHFGRLAGRHE